MDERGASAVEYGLLVAGIAALIVAIVFIFGSALNGIFKDTCDKVTVSATTKSDLHRVTARGHGSQAPGPMSRPPAVPARLTSC